MSFTYFAWRADDRVSTDQLPFARGDGQTIAHCFTALVCILFVLFAIFREKLKFLHYRSVVNGNVFVQMAAANRRRFSWRPRSEVSRCTCSLGWVGKGRGCWLCELVRRSREAWEAQRGSQRMAGTIIAMGAVEQRHETPKLCLDFECASKQTQFGWLFLIRTSSRKTSTTTTPSLPALFFLHFSERHFLGL